MRERGATRLEAEIAVIGAGPAGIAAATRAAEAGRRVVVVDEGPRPGGQIWRHLSRDRLPRAARTWLARLDASGARILPGASVVDIEPVGRAAGDPGTRSDGGPDPTARSGLGSGFRLAVERRGEPVAVEAEKVIVATGARERFLPFPGWTLPNVVGVGGAQALLKSGAPFAGRRVVVAGSGPLLPAVAASLRAADARIAIVAEQAPAPAVLRFAARLSRSPGKLAEAVRYGWTLRGVEYRPGTWVARADGDAVVREATLSDGRRRWTVPCDVLCTGFGLVPNLQTAAALGCETLDGAVRVDALQRTSVPGVWCAGEPTGVAGVEAALLEGEIAGYAAAGREREARRLFAARDRQRTFGRWIEAAFAPRTELRALPDAGTVVCRCEDVALGRIRPGWDARQARLYVRAGMGPCQARICGPALEFLCGWTPDAARPPVAPASVAALLSPDA